MAKTLTMRVDDDVYGLFLKAAKGARRNISNFIEFAAMSYLSEHAFVSDAEMKDILADKELCSSLRSAQKDVKSKKYEVVK